MVGFVGFVVLGAGCWVLGVGCCLRCSSRMAGDGVKVGVVEWVLLGVAL